MEADGSDLQRISEDRPYGPQWSPDGTMLSYGFHTGQTYEDIEAVKVINAQTGSEVLTFNVAERQGYNAGFFWTPDSKSIIVYGLVFEFESNGNFQLMRESWQVSTASGQILRTLSNKTVGAVIDNNIIYSKGKRDDFEFGGIESPTVFISDIDGGNEQVFFTGGEGCERYKIIGIHPRIVADKITLLVGGETNPYGSPPECTMQRVAILGLETKQESETEPIVHVFELSPAGEYLAVLRDDYDGLSYRDSRIDLYSTNGDYIKNLAMHICSSQRCMGNLIFLHSN